MCDAVIIATVGASMMGIKAQQEAAYAEVQAVEMQKQQLSEQAEASRIEMLQKANDRKREAMSAIARNEAQLTAMGVTFDSPSYQALKKSNVATVKRDLGRIGMSQFDKERSLLRQRQQLSKQQEAIKSGSKAKTFAQVANLGFNLYGLQSELNPDNTPNEDS